MSTPLTRTRSVFELAEAREDLDDATFFLTTMGKARRFHMSWADFDEMGQPGKITVIVEPGDRLN